VEDEEEELICHQHHAGECKLGEGSGVAAAGAVGNFPLQTFDLIQDLKREINQRSDLKREIAHSASHDESSTFRDQGSGIRD